MTSLACKLIRLHVEGCWVERPGCLQTPTLPVLGNRTGPVPKGRTRRETPPLRAFKKLEEG